MEGFALRPPRWATLILRSSRSASLHTCPTACSPLQAGCFTGISLSSMNSAFLDYYRCPKRFAAFTLSESPFRGRGFFQFGANAICYGQCSDGSPSEFVSGELHDAMSDVVADEKMVRLSFNPSEVIANLHYERYPSFGKGASATARAMTIRRTAYYCV